MLNKLKSHNVGQHLFGSWFTPCYDTWFITLGFTHLRLHVTDNANHSQYGETCLINIDN